MKKNEEAVKKIPLYPEWASDCNGCVFYGDIEAQARARMIRLVEEAARYVAMGLVLAKPCSTPHWRVTSQDMALRCAMAAHLEAGKDYDLSVLVVNANGNCATCKGTISKAYLFAACPCGQTEVRLLSREGQFNAGKYSAPDVVFDHHKTPEGDLCRYVGSKVVNAHAHEAFFAHLAAGINRLE